MSIKTSTNIKPFVKWLGGKTKLMPQLSSLWPEEFNRYYEPFLGGGASFFSLAPSQAILNDLNPHLINLYTQIRDNLEELDEQIHEILAEYLDLDETSRSDYYYQRREEFNQGADTDIRGAVLFLFLNKTCYNGVYRENSLGQFNVPFGRRKSITLHEFDNIEKASLLLDNATIIHGGYESALQDADNGDFIYLDPPYVPLNSTSNFTQYVGSKFNTSEHIKLKEVFDELNNRGCLVMMSNSDTPIVSDLYKKYRQTKVYAERAVNCKAQGRGKITELVITNY